VSNGVLSEEERKANMKMTEIVLKAKIFKLHQQQNNSIDESEDLQQNLLSLDIYG